MNLPDRLTPHQITLIIALHEVGALPGGECANGVKLHQIGGQRGSLHHQAAKWLQPVIVARRWERMDWGVQMPGPAVRFGARVPSYYRLTAYGARVGAYLRGEALASAYIHKSLPMTLAAACETGDQGALQG